MLLLLFNSFIF